MINKIILASRSGVRKEILNQNGIICKVIPADIDEDQVKESLIEEKATPERVAKFNTDRGIMFDHFWNSINKIELEVPGYVHVDGYRYSPIFDLSDFDEVILTYYRWYTNNIGDNGGSDKWIVSVSNNNGATWVDLENSGASSTTWEKKRFILYDYCLFYTSKSKRDATL